MATLVRTCEVDTEGLSVREMEILTMTFDRMNDKEIANHIGLSPYTVQTYKKRIRKKKKVHLLNDVFKNNHQIYLK